MKKRREGVDKGLPFKAQDFEGMTGKDFLFNYNGEEARKKTKVDFKGIGKTEGEIDAEIGRMLKNRGLLFEIERKLSDSVYDTYVLGTLGPVEDAKGVELPTALYALRLKNVKFDDEHIPVLMGNAGKISCSYGIEKRKAVSVYLSEIFPYKFRFRLNFLGI